MNGELFYPPWLRFWHWTNAAAFLVLVITGTSMHFAEPGVPQIDFRTARVVHNAAAGVMTAGYVTFLAGTIFGANRRYYKLNKGDIPQGALRQARYYLLGIFRGEPKPFPHGVNGKFNPLQKIAYVSVMGLLIPVLIVTGGVLFVPDMLPERGVTVYAFAHSIVGYLLSLFLVVHIYLGTTGDTLTGLYRAMLTGHTESHGHHT